MPRLDERWRFALRDAETPSIRLTETQFPRKCYTIMSYRRWPPRPRNLGLRWGFSSGRNARRGLFGAFPIGKVVGREIEKAPLTSGAFLLHEKDIPRTHVY